MKAKIPTILAALLLSVLPASAQETYLYTNEFLAPGLSYVNNAEGFAFGFRTDSFSYGPIELQIWAMNISAGTYSLGLYSDGGGQPGTLLYSYSGTTGGAPIGNPAVISFFPDGPMSLDPDTTYYIVMPQTLAPGVLVSLAQAENGYTTAPGHDWSYQGFALQGDNGNWEPLNEFYVNSAFVEIIPESATIFFVAAGAALLLCRSRLRTGV